MAEGMRDPGSQEAPQERAWEQEYEALLEHALANRRVERLPAGLEKREQPRFRLRTGSIGVQLETQVPVIDVSISGLSFRAALALQTGLRLNLVLARAFLVEAEVVGCEAMSTDAAQGWRVHCSFRRHEDGMRLLVMLHAMGSLDVDAPEP